MATLAEPVLNIRNITDKDEIIVDISVSVFNDNRSAFVLNAGYAIISLKNEHHIVNTTVPFLTPDDSKRFNDIATEYVKQLKDFMRAQRGYEINAHVTIG